jgi:hypothetical protein
MAGSSERIGAWTTGPVPDRCQKANRCSVRFRYLDTGVAFTEAYQRPATDVN